MRFSAALRRGGSWLQRRSHGLTGKEYGVAPEWGRSAHRALVRVFAVSRKAVCLGCSLVWNGLSVKMSHRSEREGVEEGHVDRRAGDFE